MTGFDLNHALFLDGVFIPGPGSDGSLVPPPPPDYATGAVHFDGTTDLTKASLAGTDSPFFLLSYWFNIATDQGGSTTWTLNPAGDGAFDFFASPNMAPGLTLRNDNIVTDNIAFSVLGVAAFSTWHHVLAVCDTNHAAGARPHALYLDDVSVINNDSDNGIAFTLAVNTIAFVLGSDGFGAFMTADIADFWWSIGQFLDIGITANRRKFISSTLKPVDVGADGSTPTGTAPTIFLRRDPTTGTATDFATDKSGHGNTLTVNGGGLTDAATSPTD